MGKKLIAVLVFALVVIGIFSLYKEGREVTNFMANSLGFSSQNCGGVNLERITKKLNRDLPKDVSKIAKWVRTEHEQCEMKYIFKYEFREGVVTEKQIRNKKIPGIKKMACNKDLSNRLIVENGISLKYIFNDTNGNRITTITVDKEYCNSL